MQETEMDFESSAFCREHICCLLNLQEASRTDIRYRRIVKIVVIIFVIHNIVKRINLFTGYFV